MSPPTTRRGRVATPIRAGAALTLVLAVTAFGADAAYADGCQKNSNRKFGCVPTLPGGSSGGGSAPGGTGGGGGSGGGSGPVEPPPPEGLTPDQGIGAVPVPGGPAPLAAPAAPPTIALAQQARSSAEVPVPKVHTAPKGKTYVRVRTALWVDGFETVTTEPIKVGDQEVIATATPKSVEWNLGETTLTCNDAGSKDGRSCGYTYKRSSAKQPGGAYQITATIRWGLTWTCTGADCDSPGGTLEDLTATSVLTPLIVSEIQTNSRQ